MSLLDLKKKIPYGITSNMETYFAVPTEIAIQILITPFAMKEHKGITIKLKQRQDKEATMGLTDSSKHTSGNWSKLEGIQDLQELVKIHKRYIIKYLQRLFAIRTYLLTGAGPYACDSVVAATMILYQNGMVNPDIDYTTLVDYIRPSTISIFRSSKRSPISWTKTQALEGSDVKKEWPNPEAISIIDLKGPDISHKGLL